MSGDTPSDLMYVMAAKLQSKWKTVNKSSPLVAAETPHEVEIAICALETKSEKDLSHSNRLHRAVEKTKHNVVQTFLSKIYKNKGAGFRRTFNYRVEQKSWHET